MVTPKGMMHSILSLNILPYLEKPDKLLTVQLATRKTYERILPS